MKLMSARASCAPAPISTVNRAPAIFVPRSKSMMPSAGPRSQCACGSKSNARGVPDATHLDVVVGALARPARSRAACSGCGAAGRVRSLLDRLELRVELLDLLAALRGWPRPAADASSPCPLCARHLFASRVLLALQAFDFGRSARGDAPRAARGVELRSRRRRRRDCSGQRGRGRGCRAGRPGRSCVKIRY